MNKSMCTYDCDKCGGTYQDELYPNDMDVCCYCPTCRHKKTATRDCTTCTYESVPMETLPCRECYDSFAGIAFPKPSNWEPIKEAANDTP